MKYLPRRWLRRLLLVFFLCGFFIAAASESVARPGGGGSYGGGRSGGSHSYSSGSRSWGGSGYHSSYGSSSGTALSDTEFVIFVLFVGVVILVMLLSKVRESRPDQWQEWSTEPQSQRSSLEAIRASDPNFSVALLDDFLQALFVEVHSASGQGTLDRLAPYLSADALQSPALQAEGAISTIIVGAMRYESVIEDPQRQHTELAVIFDCNYTVAAGTEAERAVYVVERWTLRRKQGLLSRTPERSRVIACPSCGAPLEQTIGGVCRSCQQTTATGDFDWRVEAVEVLSCEPRGPMLIGTTEEQGTDLPTITYDHAARRLEELGNRDPAFSWAGFEERVQRIFSEFQTAWSQQDLLRMRPFLSDRLFQTQVYWIEAYKAQGLRNITEEARVHRLAISRVDADAFFDAITIRLWASSLDFTVDASGALVSGSRDTLRAYSEYWTLIRGRSAQGPVRGEGSCPACGAVLKINMAGHCEYCAAKVTSGDFDWVLSRIEQDEAYRG